MAQHPSRLIQRRRPAPGHPGAALSVADVEASFKGQGLWKQGLPRILETLEALGRARREATKAGDGWHAS